MDVMNSAGIGQAADRITLDGLVKYFSHGRVECHGGFLWVADR